MSILDRDICYYRKDNKVIFDENVYIELVGGICLGAVFFIGCAYLFRFKELQELIHIITKRDFSHE